MQRRDFLRAAAAAALCRAVAPPRALATRPAPAPAPAPFRRTLYVAGYFSGTDVVMMRRATDVLAASDFNVLILAFLHVHHSRAGLKLLYNERPAGAWAADAPLALKRLRDAGKTLLISIGGWGNAADFAAIRQAGVERFLDALDEQIIGPLSLAGIDLDLEPGELADNTPAGWRRVNAEYGATLVALTNGFMRRHPRGLVTHAPIASVAATLYARDGRLPGVPGGYFAACRGAQGNRLAWINIQLYEAGNLFDGVVKYPGGIANFWKRDLLDPLHAAAHENGLLDPASVLLPGFEPHLQKFDDCAGFLQSLRGAGIRVPGFFLWQYGQISPRMAQWDQLGTGDPGRS